MDGQREERLGSVDTVDRIRFFTSFVSEFCRCVDDVEWGGEN
jgi:hypothetical protein